MESRSTFVTVVAWVFIVGAGFTSLISIMQVVMVSTMFSGEEFKQMPEDAPTFARIMASYFHLFVYGFFCLSIYTFISAIALLKRKNWARISFIVIMAIGVLWQIAGLVMQFTMFSNMPIEHADEQFKQMQKMMQWFTVIISIGMSGLFIWIIKRLTTEPILSEFTLNQQLNRDAASGAA